MKVNFNNSHKVECVHFDTLPKGAVFFYNNADEPLIKISHSDKMNAFDIRTNATVHLNDKQNVNKYTIARLELEP